MTPDPSKASLDRPSSQIQPTTSFKATIHMLRNQQNSIVLRNKTSFGLTRTKLPASFIRKLSVEPQSL